jgi:hypothetical protein
MNLKARLEWPGGCVKIAPMSRGDLEIRLQEAIDAMLDLCMEFGTAKIVIEKHETGFVLDVWPCG